MNAAVSRSADDSMTLHHAALYVSDLAKTRDFYSGVLGMEEIPRPADFTFPGAYFRRDGAEVHVVVETDLSRRPGRVCRRADVLPRRGDG
jgi:catechol 2,3-dioxygenase-like lactoylglutathione lyase family enzyme